MINVTDKDFINKFDNNIDFSNDEKLSICNGLIGSLYSISENPKGDFTRIFQAEGRWFRVYWTERLINDEIIIDYSLVRIREMQSNYDYIRSLNIHDLAEYLREFVGNELSLCEIKHMLADYREDGGL